MATWTSLTYAFGSKLTSAKMTQNQDNFLALAEGASGAPKLQSAAYDTGSIDQSAIGASEVGQGELISATASQSQEINAESSYEFSPTGGEYAFALYIGQSGSGIEYGAGHSGTYDTILRVDNTAPVLSRIAYLYHRYIQASPPYKIGNQIWGHFIYLLRKIGTGEIIGTYEAPDPLYHYMDQYGDTEKDSIDRMLIKPHPFNQEFDKNGDLTKDYKNGNLATLGVEVILIDTRNFDIIEFKKAARSNGLDLAKEVMNHHAIENTVAFKALGINDNIPGLTDRIKIKGLV